MQLTRIGLEAGPLSQWLHAGLTAAGYEVVLLERGRRQNVEAPAGQHPLPSPLFPLKCHS